uniref:Uncharacterized protein n=1 Tax=Aegilops tauschii subsp. strangulata TaxID=200361 RepID=A0A453NEQ0_AEGTS
CTAVMSTGGGQAKRDIHSSTSHPLFLTPSYLPPRSTTQLCSSLGRSDADAMEDAAPPLLLSVPPTPWRTPLHPCSSLKVLHPYSISVLVKTDTAECSCCSVARSGARTPTPWRTP